MYHNCDRNGHQLAPCRPVCMACREEIEALCKRWVVRTADGEALFHTRWYDVALAWRDRCRDNALRLGVQIYLRVTETGI